MQEVAINDNGKDYNAYIDEGNPPSIDGITENLTISKVMKKIPFIINFRQNEILHLKRWSKKPHLMYTDDMMEKRTKTTIFWS